MMTGPGTNTYLLGNDTLTVLDPGPEDAAHLRLILEAGGGRIRTILVTHTHRDHSPLAATLADATGAQLIGLWPPTDGRQDETFRPAHAPGDGEHLLLGDVELIAIHTPGHASNCVCYFLASERLLFSGDHVLEGVSPVILPPDGNMAAYLNSLDKLLRYDVERIAPGHGGLIDDAPQVLAALRAHRLARERKTLQMLAGREAVSLDRLTPLVYDDVSAERHAWAQLTLQAHLIKLQGEGRVAECDGRWQETARALQ